MTPTELARGTLFGVRAFDRRQSTRSCSAPRAALAAPHQHGWSAVEIIALAGRSTSTRPAGRPAGDRRMLWRRAHPPQAAVFRIADRPPRLTEAQEPCSATPLSTGSSAPTASAGLRLPRPRPAVRSCWSAPAHETSPPTARHRQQKEFEIRRPCRSAHEPCSRHGSGVATPTATGLGFERGSRRLQAKLRTESLEHASRKSPKTKYHRQSRATTSCKRLARCSWTFTAHRRRRTDQQPRRTTASAAPSSTDKLSHRHSQSERRRTQALERAPLRLDHCRLRKQSLYAYLTEVTHRSLPRRTDRILGPQPTTRTG